MIDPDATYTVEELAAEWKCDVNSVYRRIRSGDLRSFVVGKNGKRIYGSCALAYMGAPDFSATPTHQRAS